MGARAPYGVGSGLLLSEILSYGPGPRVSHSLTDGTVITASPWFATNKWRLWVCTQMPGLLVALRRARDARKRQAMYSSE